MGRLAQRGGTQDNSKFIDVLLDIAENEYKKDTQGNELSAQAGAFSVLLSFEEVPRKRLLAITETWDEAIAHSYGAFGKDATFVADYAEDLQTLKKRLLEMYPNLNKEH